jgi:23S rRNA pseudouridine1911/1915/1917 synthase
VRVLDHPAAPLPKEEHVKIRFVDTQVVVVEKPAGVTSNRHAEERSWPSRRKQLQPTLDELLPRILAKTSRPGRGLPERAGRPRGKAAAATRGRGPLPPIRAVHRLDRETSGLMVFARTRPAEQHLSQQFRRHTTHRVYLAIVQGRIESQTIVSHLARDRGDGRRGSTTQPNQGKRAVTHVKQVEQLGEYTLVECRLETGRTHQIRIHLAEAGHPLCGEKVYRQPLFGEAVPDRSGAPRIALHAAELGFEHPATGEEMRFKMALPPDLVAFLARLRSEARKHHA